MTDDRLIELLEDYAARRARGERPDVGDYLARAGEGADELGRLLDAFLTAAPPARRPTADELVAVQQIEARVSAEPPLLARRVALGIRRAAVVDAIVEAFGLAAKREKVERRWHEVETGLIAPRRLSERLRQVVERVLGEGALDTAWPVPRTAPAMAVYRRSEVRLDLLDQLAPPPAPEEERDEVDELFGVR